MKFNRNLNYEGRHAFLGASTYHWLNYTEEKLIETYHRRMAAAKGTELHELAAQLINMGIKLPASKKTLNMYVNDCIGFKMNTEQPLVYSDNCFGTADAISFRKNTLRIFDYKSGVSPVHMEQLLIYASYFCLEYGIKPKDITIILRLYHMNEIIELIPEIDIITQVMNKVIKANDIIQTIREAEEE